jgi:hypothetical protein
MALRGGAAGLATNLATGQDFLKMGGGLRDAYKITSFDPIEIGKAMMGKGTGKVQGLDAFKKDGKYKILEGLGITSGEEEVAEEIADKKKKGLFGSMSIRTSNTIWFGTARFGLLIQSTSDDEDVGLPADTMPEGNVLQGYK